MTTFDRPAFFIDGKAVAPRSEERLPVFEAATEELLGTAALAGPADLDAAVGAARRALVSGPWGSTTAEERSKAMLRFAECLAAHGDETSTLVSKENGTPIGLSTAFNGQAPAGLLQMYAQLLLATPLEEVRPSAAGATIVRREPVGVVGAIVPWNYPQTLAMMKIAPALAAGCTVVVKPSPETALDAWVLAEAAMEAELPPGVLNIVPAGREVGAQLVSHPGIDKVAFTGSTAAGRAIGAECGRLVRRVTLELGGKSAAIVLDDADLDVFVNGLGFASFMNNGQTCTTQARILAPLSRYDEVVDAVAGFARSLAVGDPLDPATQLGPMATETHRNRVLGHIEVGRNSDARLVTGGGRPAGQDRGWFVEPTVFADLTNAHPLARDEIFGPVMTVIPYDGDDEAIAIANDSEYGLGGSVWTTDEQRGLDVARRIRTGTIGVNYYQLDLGSPFGGMKSSGIGRELGPEGLLPYFELKSMYGSAALLTP